MLEKLKEKFSPKKAETKDEKETAKTDEVKDEPVKNPEPVKGEEDKSSDTEKPVDAKEPQNGIEPENEDEKPESEDTAQVETAEPVGNGIQLSDLVTKDELTERIAALSAKLDAVIKENADLKEQNSGLKSKYEDEDFGNVAKKGTMDKSDGSVDETFDQYASNY